MEPPRKPLTHPLIRAAPARCGPSIRRGIGGHIGAATFSRAVRRARERQHAAKDMPDTTGVSVLGRVRLCRCYVDPPAS
eukprot:8223680-Pyramimonas_sp.AAC.1